MTPTAAAIVTRISVRSTARLKPSWRAPSSLLSENSSPRYSPPRHFSVMADYAERAQQWGMAPKDEIRTAVESDPKSVFVDVRSPQELEEATLKNRPFVHAHCTMSDTSNIMAKADEILPDKNATVVVFCAVGGRSSKAKAALESMGYTNVYNGGGLKDIDYLDS
uniref:Rhodanese domain-containing protein n=1 Tax=Trieres chinensis TaxID=1514140 RepID=A0A7S2EXN5_TRICV|mmetsp:Transcript_8265/g.17496  ORF Transcript_8265/g.17496 Transcript_8265/m.17496 type:complete len:165 (+) Transcript_8265:56-550(+)